MRKKITSHLQLSRSPPNPVAYHLPRALYPTGARAGSRQQSPRAPAGASRPFTVHINYCTRSEDTTVGVQNATNCQPRESRNVENIAHV
jgi:hypothetical protein